ncbi:MULTISPECIES: preprotein translocase subunit SecE [Actinomyces]|uniref:Protein translocase subunit SecE n=2 Tax=Actinomyces TaxID=1654 RepID=A0A1M4RWG6_9ACTO|nr:MULTISPECIES: preprotein translocase subunit SecE [Actinomyces]MBE6482343.1 preprotein translocase subunit SecE [Actinomyces ruminicola]MBE6476116.1 preprotein translocase subunit SecE [Actinomyces succiniciruminis]MBM6978942.1 preprotein translocase subunit SecE [Actinomyces succiniciruminis]RAX21734.1 preprotein translocase subunit SecE [Actinomyces sp. Z3]RAX22196.1 preprotein translocase subunit SecE [Actinomyces sp. Z5]
MSDTRVAKGTQEKRRGPISRIALYFRQVIDELRKVVWPTRNELWTYFAVVVVFILAIMLFTGVLDAIFDRLVMWAFA